MHIDFCTIFNHHYLSRALAMYKSLERTCDSFHVYAYVIDDISLQFFNTANYPNITVLPIKNVEDEALLAVKNERTIGEYCWTCTPSLILHSIEKYNLQHCTYIDADLFFYQNPKILIEEMGDASVLITPHNFSSEYLDALKFGKYCIQFMTFKNDEYGMKALKWWREACINWCYNRLEDGKFGDQLYLDDWLTRFEKIHELKQEGTLAPWNNASYDLLEIDKKPFVVNKKTKQKSPLIFYHFHGFKFIEERFKIFGISLFKRRKIDFGSFYIEQNIEQKLYTEYLNKIKLKGSILEAELKDIDVNGVVMYDRLFENIFGKKSN